MAKAIVGHLSIDPRAIGHVAAENRRLRTRVAELEDLVLRLSAENDNLVAAQSADLHDPSVLQDMQPA